MRDTSFLGVKWHEKNERENVDKYELYLQNGMHVTNHCCDFSIQIWVNHGRQVACFEIGDPARPDHER